MSDGDRDADKDHGRVNENEAPTLSGDIPSMHMTYTPPQSTFKVVDSTEDYYVFKRDDGTVGAVEKDKVRVVTISGYIR